jgi:hypothetical protein
VMYSNGLNLSSCWMVWFWNNICFLLD